MEDKIRCMVLDDEPHAIEILSLYIEKTPFLELEQAENKPWGGIKYLKENHIDLLFLDIQMEDLTGLQVLDLLPNPPKVILTTAYEQYALKGYEYKVVDYLLKPFSYDRFLKAVSQVKSDTSTTPKKVSKVEVGDEKDHIFIKGDAKNKFHRLLFSEIKYIEGLKNYVTFHCENERITALHKMSVLENDLPGTQFCRVHKSFIVNLSQIRLVEGNMIHLKEKTIPIGASYKSKFLELIKS